MGEVGDHYRTTRERVTELLDVLEPGDETRAVPACPGWTVHDLFYDAPARWPLGRFGLDLHVISCFQLHPLTS